MVGLNDYSFRSVWIVDAPIEAVWDALVASERWPKWWPFLDSVTEIARGDDSGVGSVRRYDWGGALPYSLSMLITVTRIEPLSLIEGAARGDIEGTGSWVLSGGKDGPTRVVYTLRARATKTWMRLAAPLLGWYFIFNHHRVMRAGWKGLCGRLGVEFSDRYRP